MKKFSELRKEISPYIKKEFLKRGFITKEKDQYFYVCDNDFFAVFFIQYSGRNLNYLAVNPLTCVGIPLVYSTLYDKIMGKDDEIPDAKILHPLSYLTPKKTFYTWTFVDDGDVEGVMSEMFAAIDEYAIPYFERMKDHRTFAEFMETQGDTARYCIVPLIYYNLGDYQRSRSYLEHSYQIYLEKPTIMQYDVDYQVFYDKMNEVLKQKEV